LHVYDHLYTNTENNKQLALYLDNTNIDIEVKNINYRLDKGTFTTFMKSKAKIESYDFKTNYEGKFNGTCVVRVSNKTEASHIIELNGFKYEGRNLTIVVVPFDEDHEEVDVPITDDIAKNKAPTTAPNTTSQA